ncbi:hypothetical protein ACFVYP_30590 [Kitasatospora sp. NPDC058201]|uniref:hypothetical protein n=1 Tax=Streptomycetaceae TaxID=2062 RepID=UPI002E763047|nr:hypothetical protein [Streptomyces sp. BE303]MED7949065.1 hypothetical protein [Streptomyces sp. BE303]
MTDTRTPPAEQLHYAVDLTPADIEAIHGFLHERITPMKGDDLFGSPEERAARALASLVRTARARAEVMLARLTENPDDRHRGENLHTLRQCWQSLVEVAEEWSDAPGFDRRRWRDVDADPAAAALRHRLVAKQRAEAADTATQT